MSKNDNTTSFSMIADYEGDIVKLFEGGNDGEYPEPDSFPSCGHSNSHRKTAESQSHQETREETRYTLLRVLPEKAGSG